MTGLRVEPNDLRAKATQIRNLQFSLAKGRVALSLPDVLPPTKTAVDNLSKNADLLYEYQIYGDREGWRLAETLDSVADAYEQVDEESRGSIAGNGSAPGPVVPKANELPEPVLPPALSPAAPAAPTYMDIDQAQSDLANGDAARSLFAARDAWIASGNQLQADAGKFSQPVATWDGEAAEEAYRKFSEFGEFLHTLGTSWHQLAGQAQQMADQHIAAMLEHTEIYRQYKQLEADYRVAATREGGLAHQLGEQMMDLQQKSDTLRETYAGRVQPDRVEAPAAPNSTAPTAAVGGGGTASQTGGGGGGMPSATDPSAAQTSPMSADPSQQSKGSQSGESESGSGGSPSGGGEKGGGSASGGGMPSLPGGDTGTEDIPGLDDPRVSPAADLGAGGGGSGGGGAGGGGAGAAPLQPSVSGVAVGPSPAAGSGTSGAAGTSVASGGGMMGGGMGGMPMGGHGAQQGNEKKRTPGLAPDEELYTEERPHTEGIIGRPERRAGQGKRDST